jgi:hypothetical protein
MSSDYPHYLDHLGLWKNELSGWMPDTVFDAHVHLNPAEVMGDISLERSQSPLTTFRSLTWEQAFQWYKYLYSGKTIEGLIAFPLPLKEINISAANQYIIDLMKRHSILKGFLLAHPTDAGYTIRQFKVAIKQNIRFTGVKPYFDLLGKSNDKTVMPEFIPKDLLAFMNQQHLVLMLHTSGTGMNDLNSQIFVRSIAETYPNIKIILAHMGRYLQVQDFMDFFSTDILDYPSIFLDCSSASRVEVYDAVLSRRDIWSRLLFASDIPFALITGEEYWSPTTGPILITRDTYRWSDKSLQEKFRDLAEKMTYNTYHVLKAVKDAVTNLHLDSAEERELKEMFFLKNAKRLFTD